MTPGHGHGHGHAHGHDWDGQAQDYDDVMSRVEPALRHVTAGLLDAVAAGPGTRLLDLACGPGHTTAAATARGARALGIDQSAGMVQAARARFPATPFQVGDMLAPPAGPWDAVVCRFGAHHVDPAWVDAAWAALRPGGRLALADLGAVDAEARAKGMRDAPHWVRLLTAAGFTDVRVQELPLDLAGAAARDAGLAAIVAQGRARQFRGPAFVVSGQRAVAAAGPA